MEEVMQSNTFFMLPLTISYMSVCIFWFLLDRKGLLWEVKSVDKSLKPKVDLALSLLASFGILAIGQVYMAGYLLPSGEQELINQLVIWPVNNLLIYSPIFLVLLFRQQGLETIFISKEKLGLKLLFGLGVALLAVLLFIGLRGEWNRFPIILAEAIQLKALSSFPAVFLENVALAFLFVRLKWALGLKWAIAIPALLFAFGHVPGSLAEGDSWEHIISFFLLTGSLTTFILYTAFRSKDILWLGLVHYLMDVAIKVF